MKTNVQPNKKSTHKKMRGRNFDYSFTIVTSKLSSLRNNQELGWAP